MPRGYRGGVSHPVCQAGDDDYKLLRRTSKAKEKIAQLHRLCSQRTCGAGEVMELHNWLLCFRCASEEFIVVVASLADWMANSSPPGPLIAY